MKQIKVSGRSVIQFVMEEDQHLYQKAREQGIKKAAHTNAHNPGGRLRSREQVEASQILGTLAEILVAEFIKNNLKETEVIRYDDVRTDDFVNPDLFDIKLKREENIRFVEVRSSVANIIDNPERIIQVFKLLGWYSSQNKPGEEKRDFYFQPVYIYKGARGTWNKDKVLEFFEQGLLPLYILGGTTHQVLENKGSDLNREEMLQEGAIYRTIPLSLASGLDEMIVIIQDSF